MKDEWEDVEVPQGRFISWDAVGQTVTVEVVSYSPNGGSDLNGNECPRVIGITIMESDNYRAGVKEKIAAEEFVTIDCSLASLKRTVLAHPPQPGWLGRFHFEGTYPTKKGTDGKTIRVQWNRGGRSKPAGVAADELV